MEEFEIKPEVPVEVLYREGASAVLYLAGGLCLLVITFAARFPFLGVVLSGAAFMIGIKIVASKNLSDKRPGLVMTLAGILEFIFRFGPPFMRPFAAFFLGLGAIGLLAAGIWKGVVFLMALKNRQ